MCSFRDSLTRRLHVLFGSLLFIVGVGLVSIALSRPLDKIDYSDSYFPLNIGNSWTYHCSVEGEFQFVKTLRIVAIVSHNGIDYFQTELQVKDDRPLIYYLYHDDNHHVYSVPSVESNDRDLIVTANPRVSERIGLMTVFGSEKIDLPILKQINVVRIENFDRDDPMIPAEQRSEWMGRYYSRGIGLVMEADGLGGECVLVGYRIPS